MTRDKLTRIANLLVASLSVALLLACNKTSPPQEESQIEFASPNACSTSLLETIKTEAPRVEIFPIEMLSERASGSRAEDRCNIRLDVTYERFQPFYRVVLKAATSSFEEASECAQKMETFNAKEKALALLSMTVYVLRACKENGFAVLPFDDFDEQLSEKDLEALLEVMLQYAESPETPFDEVSGDKESWEQAFRSDFLRWQYVLGKRNPFFLHMFNVAKSDGRTPFDFEKFVKTAPIEVLYTMAVVETDPDLLSKESPYRTSYGLFSIGELLNFERRLALPERLHPNDSESIVEEEEFERKYSSVLESFKDRDFPPSDEELIEEARIYRAFLLSQFTALNYYYYDVDMMASSAEPINFLSLNLSNMNKRRTLGCFVRKMFDLLNAVNSTYGKPGSLARREMLEELRSRRRAGIKTDPDDEILAEGATFSVDVKGAPPDVSSLDADAKKRREIVKKFVERYYNAR